MRIILTFLMLCSVAHGQRLGVSSYRVAPLLSTATPVNPFDFSATGPFFFAPNTAHTFELGGTSNNIFEITSGVAVSSSSTNLIYSPSQTLGAYADWANNSYSNSIMEATISLLQNQSNLVDGNALFPNGGWVHSGIGLRHSGIGQNNFAGLIMISAESSTFQIDDRSNGTEIVTIKAVPGGITYNTDYILRIENTNGSAANTYLFDANRVLLTNFSYTFNSGVPAKGWPFLHSYACSMVVKKMIWMDANSNILTRSIAPWAGVRLLPYTNNPVVVTNGNLTIDTTSGGASGWRSILSPGNYTNLTVTGTVYRNSGRIGGVVFEANGSAQTCYFAIYDNNNLVSTIRSGPPEAPTTLNTSSAVTLNTGTGYPFTFTRSNGTNLSWTVNSVTVTATNGTLTSGLVGFVCLNGSFSFSNIVVTPLP